MVGSLPAEAERLSTQFSRYFVLAIIFSTTNKIRFDASGRSVWLFFYYQFRRNVPRKSNVFTENLSCTITIQDSFFFFLNHECTFQAPSIVQQARKRH